MRIVTISMVCGAGVLLLGCKGKGANQPTCPPGQVFDGTYCVMAQPTATATATVTAPPTATVAPTATATAPPAGPTPMEQLPALVQAHVESGAQPLGPPITGNIGPGQPLTQNVQMNPGQCFTAVAAAGPGVQEIEASFVVVTPIQGSAPVLAVDKDQGPTAVVAPQPNCYRWALPMGAPAQLVVKSLSGSGPAAAQIFVK